MIAVINQPTYAPWMGYLASLDSCDVYVVHDNIEFEEKQSWQHRNKIRNQDKWMWITVPIIRRGGQLINEVLIDNSKNWQKSHWKSIQQNYNPTPYFKQYRDVFEVIYKAEWNKLIDLNIVLLQALASYLKIRMPKFVRASDIETSGHKTDRLIPILKAVGATSFIEGVAGKDYLEVKKMNDAGIEVLWFEYQHPV